MPFVVGYIVSPPTPHLTLCAENAPQTELDTLSLADPGTTPERSVEDNQRVAQVRRAIAQLSEPLRLVLILREYQELTYQEIADALDIPVGTVMSRLNTARLQLRRELLVLSEET